MKIGRNEPCPCWSGKKYKKCCYLTGENPFLKFQKLRSGWTLKERNNLLYKGIWDIFKFSKGRNWDKFRKELSNAEVKEFYEFYSWLWPVNTDVLSLLPEPGNNLRGLYIGESAVKSVVDNILRYSLYTDEILVVNPFPHPSTLNEKFNPIINPGQYKQDVLEMIFFLGMLEPWIKAGIVTLIPDPKDFDSSLRYEIYKSAEKRAEEHKEDFDRYFKDHKLDIEKEGKEMLMKMIIRLPRALQIRKIQRVFPKMKLDEIEKMLSYLSEMRKKDPLVLNQQLPLEGELKIKRMGANLELGMFIAQLTDSYLYTNNSFQWNEIMSIAVNKNSTSSTWSPLTQAFQKLKFNFLENVDAKFAYEIKQEGRLNNFRNYLRKIWNTIQSGSVKENAILNFKDELTDQYAKTKEEWKDIDRRLRNWAFESGGLIVGITGFTTIISGAINPLIPALGFSLPAIGKLMEARSNRKKFRSTVPLSILLDLENRKKILK